MFSQTTEYAMRAMVMLASRDHVLTSTTDIAESTGVPANYLAKVLQNLAAADLIVGRRGVGGGYRLARPASEIRLIDVVRAVGKLDRIERCPMPHGNGHSPGLCRLHNMMDEVVESAETILNGHTLSDLLEHKPGSAPLCGVGFVQPIGAGAPGEEADSSDAKSAARAG